MTQVKQIVCAASAAVAFGTLVGVQPAAAAASAQGAAMYRGDAVASLRAFGQAGKDRGSDIQPREDRLRKPDVGGSDRRWFGWAPNFGQVHLSLVPGPGCAAYPMLADSLLDHSGRACAPELSAPWKLAENFYSVWDRDAARPASAFGAPFGLWSMSRTTPQAQREILALADAEPTLLRRVFSACTWLFLAYAGYLAALALFQRRFVFNPTHAEGPMAEPADTHEITRVSLSLTREQAIKGWLLRPRQGRALCPGIIYYGGRTEEVSWLRAAAQWFPKHAVLALNYRGYGESEGAPSEQGLFADGLAQFDWLAAQPGVDPKAIVLVGRSLGTGVASYVAAKRPAERVVLITPYDSLLAVARRRFWFTPLSLLLRHKFKSVDYARTNRQPCLALLAEHDDVVPEVHTHRLMAAWAGAKKLVRIPRTTHLDIPYQAATLAAVAYWLGYASVPPGPLSLVARAT